MAEIDSLEIVIQDTVKDVNRNLDALIGKLGIVVKGISAIKTGKGLESFSKQAESISTSMNEVSESAKNVSKQISSAMNNVKKSMGGMDKPVEQVKKSISDIVKEISEKTIDITPELNMSNISGEIKKYETQLRNSQNALSRILASNSADKQVKGIERLIIRINEAQNALKKIKSDSTDISSFAPYEYNGKKFSNVDDFMAAKRAAEQAKESINNLGNTAERVGKEVTNAWNGVKIPDELKQNIQETSNQISEFEKALKNIQPLKFSGNFYEMEKWVSDLQSGLEKLYTKQERLNDLGVKPDTRGMKNLALDIEQITKTLDLYEKKLDEARAAGKLEIQIPSIDAPVDQIVSKTKILKDNLANMKINLSPDSLQEIEKQIEKVKQAYLSLVEKMGKAANVTPFYGASADFKKKQIELSALRQRYQDLINKQKELTVSGQSTASKLSFLSEKVSSLARFFDRLNQALKNTIGKLLSFKNHTEKATKKTNSFIVALGKLYAAVWALRRVFNGLWGSIEKSIDYIETLNYFDAAFGQVAENADLSQWKQLGYDSAEAYYNSFSSRAKELTSKMSGFFVGKNGILEATKMPSLGIDPTQVMNYQAIFGQMSSSMGIASETALKLSDALTMIGADLASVKNMDFDKVWQDMASGLTGMSRTLDKYGVNIRNANLQQKLIELGIDANISALNQNDKALLRTIILLENTKYAWGDLARTINQPANQIRLLRANIASLSRMIGNLFLPIVAKVLPYINAFVIALQRLFTWIGRILGINISNISSSIGSAGDSIGDLIGDTEDENNSLENAADNAKKLKNNLLGIDELNILSEDQSDSLGEIDTSGIGGLLDDAFYDALAVYQDAWDKAFSNMENKANELADKIVEFAKYAFQPISKAWAAEGDFVVESWKNAFGSIKDLISSIGRDLMTVWQQDKTVDVLKDIFHIFGDIGQIVSNLADNFEYAWSKNKTGLHILENIRDIFGEIIHNIRIAADYTVEWSKKLNFSPLLEAFERMTRTIADKMGDISGIFTDFYQTVILGLAEWTIESGLPHLLDVIRGFVDKVDWEKLRKNLQEFWTHLERFGETVGEGLIIFIERISDALANFVNSPAFEGFLKMLENWMDSVSPEDVADALELILKAILAYKAVSGITSALKTVDSFLKIFKDSTLLKGIADIGKKIDGLFAKGGAATSDGGIFATLSNIASKIGGILTKIGGFAAVIGGAWTAIKNFFGMLDEGFNWVKEALMLVGIAITAVGAIILGAPAVVAGVVAAIVAAVGTAVVLIKDNWENIKEFFINLWNGIKETAINTWNSISEFFTSTWQSISSTAQNVWGGIRDFFSGIWDGIKNTAQTVWNGLTEFLENVWNFISKTAITIWNGISEFFRSIWDGIKTVTESIWGGITSFLENTWNFIKSTASMVWEAIRNVVIDVWNGVSETISSIWEGIKNFLSNIWESIKSIAVNLWNSVKSFFEDTWNEIKNTTENMWNAIASFLQETWQNIKGVAESIWNSIRDFLRGIWEGIKSIAESVWNAIFLFLKGIWENIRNTAETVWNGISELLKDIWNTIKKIAEDAWNAIKSTISNIWESIKTIASAIFNEIKDAISGVWDDIKTITSNVWELIKSTVVGTLEGIKESVSTIFDGIVDTIKGIFDGIIDFITGVFTGNWEKAWNGVVNIFKNAFNLIPSIAEGVLNGAINGINGLINGINNIGGSFGIWIPNIPSINLPRFAAGGFPEDGLFYANHTELVGQFSNGKTAVANNEQIIAGIEEAAYRGFLRAQAETSPYLADIAENTRRTAEKDMSVKIGDRDIVDSYRRGSTRMGYSFT